MELTKYGDIGNATAGWYETMLLSYAKPDIISEPFGLVKRIPRNKTRVVQYRRPQQFKPATVPLREGVTPGGSPFGYDTISAQLNQYGDYTPLTDVVDETSIDDVYMDCAEQQGHQIALTREVLITDVICSGTSAIFGDGVGALRSGIDKTGVIQAQRLRNQIAHLKKQKAMKFKEVIMPSEDYETFGIEPSYIALTHTDMEPNIRDIEAGSSKFIPTVRYGNYSISSPFEIGNFENTRFLCGADWPIYEGQGKTIVQADEPTYQHTAVSGTNKYDVYPIMLLGKEAFGCVRLGSTGSGSVSPRILKPRPRGGDPLGQRGSVGWIMWFCVVILNEQWMRRWEVARKLA